MIVDEANKALQELKALKDSGDVEAAHADADQILRRMVFLCAPHGKKITDAYDAVPKWFA